MTNRCLPSWKGERDTDTETYTEERGTEKERQSESQEELEITEEKTKTARDNESDRELKSHTRVRKESCPHALGGGGSLQVHTQHWSQQKGSFLVGTAKQLRVSLCRKLCAIHSCAACSGAWCQSRGEGPKCDVYTTVCIGWPIQTPWGVEAFTLKNQVYTERCLPLTDLTVTQKINIILPMCSVFTLWAI